MSPPSSDPVRRVVVLDDGVRLAVAECGAGTPVVLLHAWGETHRSFDRVIGQLPDGLRLLVPDQRGVGESDKPASGYRLGEASEDIVGMLDALEIPAAWLVGSSSGGYVAQRFAVDHPQRLLGLVLVGAPASLAGLDPFGEILAGFHDPVTPQDVAALNQRLALPGSIPGDFLDAQVAAALTIPRHVWLAGYEGLVAAAPPTESGRILAPTLLLHGADDTLLGPATAAGLVAAIPGSRLRMYQDTGHFVLWERPGWVARDIADFLTPGRR